MTVNVETVAVLNHARRVVRAIRYRPSCEMAIRGEIAARSDMLLGRGDVPEGDRAIRVMRRYLKLSRAKRRASSVTVGGGRLRVSRWGE